MKPSESTGLDEAQRKQVALEQIGRWIDELKPNELFCVHRNGEGSLIVTKRFA